MIIQIAIKRSTFIWSDEHKSDWTGQDPKPTLFHIDDGISSP